jgi:ATP-dependent RNA helicase SUPV3L1/SUV3
MGETPALGSEMETVSAEVVPEIVGTPEAAQEETPVAELAATTPVEAIATEHAADAFGQLDDVAAGSVQGDVAEIDAAPVDAAPPEMPAEIEIWRVARPERQRQERSKFNPRDNRRQRPSQQPQPTAGAAPVQEESQPRRDEGRREERNKRFDAFKRQGKGGPQEPRGPLQERQRPGRDANPKPPERKPPVEKKPDPDSPFAKLAALKAQLEGKS